MAPKLRKTSQWVTCDSCQINLPFKDIKNHFEIGCSCTPMSWNSPFILNEVLYTVLDKIIGDEYSKISVADNANFVMISQSALSVCNFIIGELVLIESLDLPSVVRRVWPANTSSCSSVAFPQKSIDPAWKQKENVKISVQKFDFLPLHADSVYFTITSEHSSIGANPIFIRFICVAQHNKIISINNSIQMLYYGKNITVKIVKIVNNSNCASDTSNNSYWFLLTDNTKWVYSKEFTSANVQDSGAKVRVGGVDTILDEIRTVMKIALKVPKEHSSAKHIKTVLLYGHSGTGKTLICNYIASESNANIIKVNGSEIYSKFYGETEAALKKLFSEAIKSSPSIILIDEIDTLCPKRNSAGTEQEKRIVSTIATLLDNLHNSLDSIFILCNSSKPDSIDPALRRYGRIDYEIEVPIPDQTCRHDILNELLLNVSHNLTVPDIKMISDAAHGFVGADIGNLCTQASMHMLKNNSSNSILCLPDFLWALNRVSPSAMREVLIGVPNIKWSDIGGQNDLKLKLKQAIEWPLKHSDSFLRLGIKPPSGVLMYGPPGCSKTMIAKALANESKINFLSIKGPELFSKWVGESERAVRELFRKARQVAPSIIFFDEIDALGGERSSRNTGSNVQERVLAQILTELDGISPLGNVTIVAATNRPDKMDSALLRPGRLDRIVYVPLPNDETRLAIFNIKLSKMPLSKDVNIEYLMKQTEGYSGAEIQAVCQEAALKALEEDIECTEVLQNHFEEALRMISPRTSPSLIELYAKFEQSLL